MIKLINFLKESQVYKVKIINKDGSTTEHNVPAESPVELNAIISGLKKSKRVADVKILGLSEGENTAIYKYELDPKSKKYIVLKTKGGAKVTEFDNEDKAKKHVEKLNKLDKGYSKIKGKVTEDEDGPGSSKLSHMSLGMKTTRVVISGDDVAANQDKILKLGQEMDPNFDAKFFPATGKIVGSMSQVKVQPLNLKLRDRKWKATAESKAQTQSLKK